MCFNPWKPRLVWITLKNLLRCVKITQYICITKVNCLILFSEIIAVYSDNHTKFVNSLWARRRDADYESRWYVYLSLVFTEKLNNVTRAEHCAFTIPLPTVFSYCHKALKNSTSLCHGGVTSREKLITVLIMRANGKSSREGVLFFSCLPKSHLEHSQANCVVLSTTLHQSLN
jgi:hypothetical protein